MSISQRYHPRPGVELRLEKVREGLKEPQRDAETKEWWKVKSWIYPTVISSVSRRPCWRPGMVVYSTHVDETW